MGELLKDSQLRKVLHFCLLVIILIIFSKLTIDAVILGAIAMFIYQTKETVCNSSF